jgi:hypothetical protein
LGSTSKFSLLLRAQFWAGKALTKSACQYLLFVR